VNQQQLPGALLRGLILTRLGSWPDPERVPPRAAEVLLLGDGGHRGTPVPGRDLHQEDQSGGQLNAAS
jgi:hypothetical protein